MRSDGVQLTRSGGGGKERAQVLLDPVTLPCCGKILDKACVATLMEANPNGAKCPICRTALVAMPPVGVRTEPGL